MSDAHQTNNLSADVSVTGQIAVTITLFVVVLFIGTLIVLFLRNGHPARGTLRRRPSRRLVFAPHDPAPRTALDRSVFESLPVVEYRASDFDGGCECAVCLCELLDGEEARFLPTCNHAYHVGCIDMWFGSNSTCPLCRLPVTAHRKRELAIEVPSGGMEAGFEPSVPPLRSSRRSVEGAKSPVLEKFRSLGRVMSRGRDRGDCSASTPRPRRDIEEGAIDVSKRQ